MSDDQRTSTENRPSSIEGRQSKIDNPKSAIDPRHTSANLVDVAVMAAIRNTLTYLVPDSIVVQPGQRVQVPLATRRAMGIVLRSGKTLPPGIQARPILRVLDNDAVLSPEL